MVRGKRTQAGKRGKSDATPAIATRSSKSAATYSGRSSSPGSLPLPSPVAGTNLVIANIVLRAAGGFLRVRMEKGLLRGSYDKSKVDKLVHGRGLASSIALWGASHLASRSPVGLVVVAGGLAAKVFYDRGKRLDAERRARRQADTAADPET